MAKSDHSSEIQESPRSQPYHTPNSHVAAETEERINPELLRAIVNGDLMGFKKILGIESSQESNGGNSGLRGVTCGWNTALPKGFKKILGIGEPKDIESNQENNGGNSGLRGVTCGGNTALLKGFKKILGIGEPKDIESNQESNGGNSNLRGVTCGGNTALQGIGEPKDIQSIQASNGGNSNLRGVTCGGNTALQGIGEPKDIQSIQASNSGNSGLRGVTCGGNTALHVVVMEKSSPINALISNWDGSSLRSLVETERIAVVPKITRCLKWVFHKKNSEEKCDRRGCSEERCRRGVLQQRSVLPKCEAYVAIARIIYTLEPTLLNAQNKATKETPLHCAAKAGKLHMVSLLVQFARKEGPQKLKEVLWARNQVGETALHEAARSGYSGIVKELLSADENLASVEDDNGISPLYLAVAAGSLEVVQQLIAPKHQPSYGGPDEQTALHAAVLKRKENIMRVILDWKYGCDVHISEKTDKARNTPLHYAALIGNTSAVKQLLSKDTNSVYEDNSSGSFPVHLAAEAGNFEVIKELLRTCPDVGELLDNEQRNFLHIAVEKKKERVIKLAYKEGINVNVINAKDKDGNTPLHLAVINSESEIFALLCQNKRVNLHIRNDKGLTPLDLSASLRDHQFTYSLNPQSIIHLALETRGAFQNPCRLDLSKTVNNYWKERAVLRLNQREGKEMLNGVEVDIEKESTKYENMSKSLITGAVLIASATYVSTFTVSGVYREDNTPHTLMRRNFFKAFIIVNMAAFICAIVSTIWLLYSALSNFHLKYRKFYFKWCTSLFHVAINLFILTFGLGGYIAIAPLSEWLALLIISISGIAIFWNVIWNPSFLPLILLAPYT